MMPAAWLAGIRKELERGSSTNLLPVVDPADDDPGAVDDAPYTALEVIALLSPGSLPAWTWAITGMDVAR